MKRMSPMKMKQSPKISDKTNGTAMANYAKKRQAELTKKPNKPIPVMSPSIVEFHDPDHDLHTLTKASEIKRDKKRHSEAMGAAKRKTEALKDVMGKRGK